MCGIFALFLRRPLTGEDVRSARSALAALAHRGPDGQGEWLDHANGVYLGHRRLSIIDLSPASDQPMVRDGHALIFNGELYNFKQLRGELGAAGIACSTQGDAEVFLRGWQRWGGGVLDRADGMYALAYWDGAKATLAVDPFGEKPLFAAQTAEGVYVSSEIEPLARLLGLRPALDAEGWAAYLSLGFLPQPATFYPGIAMLPPGSMAEVRAGAMGPVRRYWELTPPQVGRGRPRPVPERELDRLTEALVDSLRDRLIADVPLGLFLSAGVDSALVAALCRRELGRDLDCLTVAFSSAEMRDESLAAGRIAAFLGHPHRILQSGAEEDAGRLAELLGQPSGTVGALSLDQICAQAGATGYKVALTGMGGDEVTAGYGKHAMLWRMRAWYRLPGLLRCPAVGWLRHVSPRLERLASLLAAEDTEIYLALKNYPALFWLRTLPGYAAWVAREFGAQPDIGAEIWIPRYELTKVMPAVHLQVADRVSMRHGVELRTPFLSRRVVETVADWDARAQIAFGQKSILRRLLARYLSRDLTDQPKTGFSYPRRGLVHTEAPPVLPGLNARIPAACWYRRGEGEGWVGIAVRMQVAARFLDQAAGEG